MNAVAQLPGIGKKTALRLVLHLVKEHQDKTAALTEALKNLRLNIKFCKTCHTGLRLSKGQSLSSWDGSTRPIRLVPQPIITLRAKHGMRMVTLGRAT